ncbi:unnamed protein product [Bemisia tabaci]|uniref:Peptidyl-prolyl cis-trans isomerase n=1 Tax=Bemisia tabaci TaxID=7038 RepID=A0A9P0A174_BEMTA|nr:unnamed protein product [Bemisia tabaci]
MVKMKWRVNAIGCCYVYILIHTAVVTGNYEGTTVSPNSQFNITHKLYFEIEQQGKELGNIIFGLYGDVVPKTVTNFRMIALMGINDTDLSYMRSRFHKVVPGVKIIGGDVINDDGSGHTSIWKRLFEDENFLIKHSEPGIVSMVNHGPNTNGCQFFITLKACPSYDGVNVAFGKVVRGMDIVYQIAKSQLDSDGEPRSPVIVTRIGELPVVGTDHPFYSWVQTDF